MMIKRYLCGLLISTLFLFPISITADEPEPEPQLVINEIMIGSEVNPEKDSWVEIYNPESEAVDLSGWEIRGITSGGRWVDMANEPVALDPDGYFLLSYYTNSRYSALSIKPQMTKSSLFFSEGDIQVEIKSPTGTVIDSASFNHTISDRFQSHEKHDSEWVLSTSQVNLKTGLENTFASPGSANPPPTELPDSAETDEPPPEDGEGDDSDATDANETPADETEGGEYPLADDPEVRDSGDTPADDPDPSEAENLLPPDESDGGGGVSSQNEITYKQLQIINEFMVNPEGLDTDGEWIELYNPASSPVNVTGWFLDDDEGASAHHLLKEAVVPSKGYLVIRAPDLQLSLKNSSDVVRLLFPNEEVSEIISYEGAKEGWTFAKNEQGIFEWSPFPSPGRENEFPPPPKAYRPDDMMIWKVRPNPDGKDGGMETITLKNRLNENIDLSYWAFINQKGKEYKLSGWMISAGETKDFNPQDIGLTLVNKADQLSLFDSAGNLIDRIHWTQAKNDQWIYRPDVFQDGLSAVVNRVIDGDTLEAEIRGEIFKIRLIGVDSPETVHPTKQEEEGGREACDYLTQRTEGKTIVLEFDENKMDTYNRLLAYVFVDGEMINKELIVSGLASVYTNYPFKYMDEFLSLSPESVTESDEEENSIENIEELEIIENTESNEENSEDAQEEAIDCPTEGLRIDAILPNSKKGETIEYIRILNTSGQKICLSGWKLDDTPSKGSKLYSIAGGAIQPGGMRSFRQKETKIALNNSNDCATLINPNDEIVDQICYNKTHKNEIFTHEGGNWVAKHETESAITISRPPKAKKINRDPTTYQYELTNETLEGEIVFIYEEGEVMYLEHGEKTIPVSYAGSHVDMSMTKGLLDLTQPVTMQVRAVGEDRQLIGIHQKESSFTPQVQSSPLPTELKYLLGLLTLTGGLYGFSRRRRFNA